MVSPLALAGSLFARPDPRGNTGRYAKRDVVHAIFYGVKGGIPWRMRPLDFPSWDTVYDPTALGINGEQALDALNAQAREKQGKHKNPTYVLIDLQSVKTHYAREDRGPAKDGMSVTQSPKSMIRSKRSVATEDIGEPPLNSSKTCWDCDWL